MFFVQEDLDCDLATYASFSRCDYRRQPPCRAYLFRGGLTNFLPVLDSNCDPPNLCLLSSWDCKHELPCPALGFSNTKIVFGNTLKCFLNLIFLQMSNEHKNPVGMPGM
jgi:hypothetical protein